MNLFFQIQSLQLLIFWMDDQEFLANFDYVLISLHLISSFFSLTRPLLVPFAYVSMKSIDYILLSSFQLKAILLVASVKTLCLSLLNLYCFQY